MTTFLDEVSVLQKEAAKQLAEAERLQKLAVLFPNLKKHVGRWNKIAYYSREANSRATGCDIRHNCGCCSDSPLEVWPYLTTEHGPVYSDPPMFRVGERNRSGGDTPYPRWEENMRESEISDCVIEQVRAYLADDVEEP